MNELNKKIKKLELRLQIKKLESEIASTARTRDEEEAETSYEPYFDRRCRNIQNIYGEENYFDGGQAY
jgi:hypothetical protein